MKRSVCVIDDDEIYQKIIAKLLQRADVFENTWFFNNAKQALEEINENDEVSPDVILLDINMPMMDGWQFIDRLKQTRPELYRNCEIYIVTSSIAYSDKEKIEQYDGVLEFLSKPLSVKQLVEIGEGK